MSVRFERLVFAAAGAAALTLSWFAAGLFQPTVLSQSRFVVGIPVSVPETISYPAGGVAALPPCNSRTNGKAYFFEGSIYTRAVCDGTAWNHWVGGVPVVPLDPANFTSFNSGPETAVLVDGAWQISAPALAGENQRIYEFPYPATPFTAVLGFISDIVEADFHGSGLTLRDSVGGRIEILRQGNLSGVCGGPCVSVGTFTGPTAGVANLGPTPTGGYTRPIYLFYTDDGANRRFSFNYIGPLPSITADSSHTVLTEASGTWVTPDRLGIAINVANPTCPISTQFFHCSINGNPCQ